MPLIKCLVGEASTKEGGIRNKLRKRNQKKNVISCGRAHIAPVNYDATLAPHLETGAGKWENLPPELLLDIIQRVEAGKTSWPARQDVVACAAVCRLWRDVIKKIVQTPEQCGLLTFPISLKQPGPRGEPIQCFIRRDRAASTYRLYLGLSPALAGDASKLLLAAKKVRKATGTEFLISLAADEFSRTSNTFVGKLSSNFLGTKFVIYDDQPSYDPLIEANPKFGSKMASLRYSPPLSVRNVTISYEINFLRTKGPRRMHCTMNTIPSSVFQEGGATPTPLTFPDDECSPYNQTISNKNEEPLILKNKAPRWHEQLQCWCLNFRGRVTVASVKNFQLAVDLPHNGQSMEQQDDVILQFGKIGKDIFTMDYRYPLSTFQALAICLSSFDTKPACE
ncbi:tubby-like F-box protein 5 [Rutidosis leptorrhynchoides]|uniref:tubby-like F-box protein 5 n=1 Tax=Rutidosis leptorrhynchoides TaxID=125765 RepID=UPI003A99E0FB